MIVLYTNKGILNIKKLRRIRFTAFLAGCCMLGIATVIEADEKKLGVTFDLTYSSRYISKGSPAYGKQGTFFETFDIDLWGTGFGVAVRHRSATSSGYVDKQRFEYTPYYKGQLFEDTPYFTRYKIGGTYKHYYGLSRKKANTTLEWAFDFQWPNIIGNGFVPGYTAYYEHPAVKGYEHSNINGWVHQFSLDYNMTVKELKNPLCISSDIWYRDGLGGETKDHDWSHATFGLSTKFDITKHLCFVPGIYYQISMEDTVCKENILYCSFSMKYKF